MQAAVKPAASKPRRNLRILPIVLGVFAFAIIFASAEYLPAQVHGYPAPSITSMAHGGFSGYPPASITSMPVRGYGYPTPGYGSWHGGFHGKPINGAWGYGGRFGNRNNGGWLYGIPYYLPYDGYGDSYDYIPGPELYSPPIGPNDPTLHIIVEQSPTRYAPPPAQADDPEQQAAVAPPQSAAAMAAAETKPLEPTVLVFRDGHKQEVTNYAIMGQTVYVFDTRPHKYALADLDVPATVKVNDDRGVEFKVPPQKSPKKNTTAPQNSPTSTTDKPQDVASVILLPLAVN